MVLRPAHPRHAIGSDYHSQVAKAAGITELTETDTVHREWHRRSKGKKAYSSQKATCLRSGLRVHREWHAGVELAISIHTCHAFPPCSEICGVHGGQKMKVAHPTQEREGYMGMTHGNDTILRTEGCGVHRA
eukprot:scaffold15688_cov23-Tisochrysis_lutea.AAC.1